VIEAEAVTGFPKPPDLGGPACLGKVPFRPIGKSIFRAAPWFDTQTSGDYIPTEMTPNAFKVGMTKSNRVVPLVPEELFQKAFEILRDELQSIWTKTPDAYIKTFEEAVDCVKRDKSPGFPYFYSYDNKGQVLDDMTPDLKVTVDRLLNGEKLQCLSSGTEKSELRPIEKVRAGKTRIFMASPIDHLIACLQLFQNQNDDLMDTLGRHPITIGIQIPGNQFVRFLTKLGDNCVDGDVDGCDLCFHPRAARLVRDLRAHFLPRKYWKAIVHLYNTIYAGGVVACGGVYRIHGNKSGWVNTAHDNSLMVWAYLIVGCLKFYPGQYWGDVIQALINGDDVLLRYLGDFKGFCDYLASIGCTIMAENWEKRNVLNCVFLSHHLRERHVSGFGDFLVAAGNLPKLLSSINWVKSSKVLSFEEGCVAHLVGLRLCLFPWRDHFLEIDELLSKYLSSIVITDFVKECLKARFNEVEMAHLHTRVESFQTFFSELDPNVSKLVLKVVRRQFKKND